MNANFFKRIATLKDKGIDTEFERQSRRVWLQNFGLVTASSAVLWACGTEEKGKASEKKKTVGTEMATDEADPVADADIVKVAMGLEYEAIALYTAAAGLDVWKSDTDKVVLAVAGSFLEHHKGHLKTLESGLADLKSKDASITDPEKKTDDEYVKAAVAAGAKLDSVAGVLRLAALKEANAAKAYLGVVRTFADAKLGEFSAAHGGDEAGHFGVLRAALLALYSDDTIDSAAMVIPSSVAGGFTQKLS